MPAVNHLEMGDEEMVECHEATSEEFSEYMIFIRGKLLTLHRNFMRS